MMNFVALFFIFCATLLVYTHNLSSSVYGGDSGDFISVVSVFGVAHPPGYPLFTILGIMANSLPLNATPAFKVGLVSVFASSLSACLMYLIVKRLTKDILLSLFSSLTLAFFYYFWLYAEIVEVFSLNTFFVLVLFYLAILYYQTSKIKYFYLLSFFIGLSLTNHQTIIFIFPSLLILLFGAKNKEFLNWKSILKSILFTLLGFSTYIYVPIAASKNPPLNWDHASNLDNFIRLVLRKDYGTFSSSSAGFSFTASTLERFLEVKHYFTQLIANITPLGFLMGILGMFFMYSKKRPVFISIFFAFLLSGPVFTAYAAFPLLHSFNMGVTERFFIESFVLFIIFIPFGILSFIYYLEHIFKRLNTGFNMKKYSTLFRLFFFLIPVLLFYYNFPKTDLSRVWIGDTLAKDLMYPLPERSVLFVAGDTPLFNTWYKKYALKERTDIDIININGISSNDFYNGEKEKFLKLNKSKPSDDKFQLKVIEYIAKKRPVYSLSRIHEKKNWVPYGLVFRFIASEDQIPSKEDFLEEQKNVWAKLNIPYPETISSRSHHNLTIANIPGYYASAAAVAGDYLVSQYNDVESSVVFFKQAVKINPSEKYGYAGLGYVYLSNNSCKEAEKMFTKVQSIDPFNKGNLVLLYATYLDCLKDQKKAKEIAKEFEDRYKTSINDQVKAVLEEI